MVVDWLQTSPGGTGVFRCFMAEAISRSCTGLIPGCPSESGWAKGDMGTGPQARCPGEDGLTASSARPGGHFLWFRQNRKRDSGECMPVHVRGCVCISVYIKRSQNPQFGVAGGGRELDLPPHSHLPHVQLRP